MANDVMAFAIALKDSIGTPEFYARVHPPLRVSPLGSPILSVSVADTRLSEKLIARHIESSQVSKTDFIRIFGKRPCPTPIFTTNGISLLRYLFRLNSTKINPSAWQSKNLPSSEYWLATFASPLYSDWVHDFTPKPRRPLVSFTPVGAGNCAHCKSVKRDMKRCGRCKSVLYCNSLCQKAHWVKHKDSCSN